MTPLAFKPCVAGMAGIYPCSNMRVLGTLLPDSTIGGGGSIWGWTDPLTSHDYVLFGLTNATSFSSGHHQ